MLSARFKGVAFLIFFIGLVSNCFSVAKCSCKENNKKRVADLLDDIDEFYNQKFPVECTTNQRLLMKVSLNPIFLDFGNQPLSIPKQLEVTMKNLDSDNSFQIVTIFGTHEAFVWSKPNQTSIPPMSSVSFNVTFLPYKLGSFEGGLYITTTRGQLKYQAFGTAYINTDHIIQFIDIDYKAGTTVASLHSFNPYTHPIQVGSIALYIPPPRSSHSDTDVNGTRIFQSTVKEPFILEPLQTTKLFTFDLPTHWGFCFAVVSYCHNPPCLSSGSSSDCVNETEHMETSLQVSMVPTSYTLDSKLLTSSSLIHFGTVSQSTSAVTKHIKLINPLQNDITIKGAETDIFDPALSLNLSVLSVPSGSLIPWAVATLTVSPLNVTHSRTLSGFVTLLTDNKGVIVRIPFLAKLIRGSLIIQERRVVTHELSPPQLRFDYVFHNHADLPVSVAKPQLPHNYRGVIRASYHGNHSCAELIQPGSKIVLFSLSILNSISRTRVKDQLSISANISTEPLQFDVFSGRLEMEIQDARLLDGVYDLGSVLLNQQGSNTIVLHNRNPIEIEIEAFGVSTASDATEAWRIVNKRTGSGAGCVTRCLVHVSDEACVSCPTKLAAGQSNSLSLIWGGIPQPVVTTGYIVLKSTYQHLIRPFRFSISRGRLSMLPNPMIVHDLFPGKTVRRNVIIQSSFPMPVKLSRLRLESFSPSDLIGLNSASFVRLYRQQSTDLAVQDSDMIGLILQPQQPTIVATIVFDPAGACVNVLSAEIGPTTTHEVPICHTGFSLDSSEGMRWLSSMTNSNETNTVDMTDWLRKGLLQSATTYAQLRSAWLTQNSKSSLSHLLEMYLSLGMVEESVDTANFPTTANTSSSIYWADLSASLIWPRLVTSRKQPVRRSVAQCLIRTSVPANTPASVSSQTEADEATLEQALRAYFPPTIPGESVQCDLIVTNPSDRPVFIQPILLDAVYAMRCNTTESCENQTTGESSRATEPLVSFLHALGVPASTEHAIKLNHLLTGTFHVELVNGSPFTGSLDAQLSSPPCCPIMWLPASAGQLVLRLTFTPDFSSSPRSSVGGKVIQQTSHNLLLLRNNLTALEPIWLNAQLGKAEISLGTVDTEENAPPSDTGTKKEAKSNIATSTGTKSRTKPISQTATLNLIVRGEWHASALPGNDNNSDPVSIGTTNGSDLLPTGLWVSSVIPPLMLPATLTPFIRMDFDFTERTFWPLCTRDSDPQLAYTIHKRLHSDLPMHEKPTAGAELPLVNSITDSGELLASLSFRRRLALINSGDVPVELRAILLVPGSRILTPNVSNDWVSDPRSGSSAFHVTCSYRGFRVSPCLTYKVQKPRDPSSAVSDETQWENKNHSILLAPRERFLIELQYRPDFVYSSTTARLWILAHPHHSGSVDMPMERLLAECMGHPTGTHCEKVIDSFRLSEVQLNALFPTGFLRLCLDALPRPWIEYTLWLVVLFLFTINLLGVMVMGCLDANRLYTAHKRVRSRLNRVPYNAQPDPIRVLRFDPLVADPFGSGSDDGTSVAQIIGDGTGTKMKSVVDRSGTVKKEPSLGLTDFEPGHLTTLSPSGILTGSSRMTSKSRSSAPSDTITVATPITTSAVKSAVGRPVVNDVRTDSGTRDEVLFSASDDEPWILSRSSFKLLSKTPLMITSSPLLKHPLEDRKMTKSARKSDALKVTSAEVVGSVPDRPGGRAKKKLSQRSGEMDEHGYPSSSEPSQLTSALSAVDDDHELVSIKLSPIRRTTRKPTTINPNSGIRSKVSDAPKTEAGIAAAVRATMRLAEETGSQARRRSTLHVSDRLRVTRDKRELLSGHSSTSSSSGPDQDPVLNKSKLHRTNMTPFTGSQREKPSPARHPVQVEQQRPQREQGHRLQQQNQTLSLPTHSPMNRSSPVNVPKRFSDYSTTDRPHEPMLEEHHPHAYLYDCFDHEDRPRAHSDFQISAPHPVCGTALDLDIQNEFVPDVLTPHLGLCWPASTVEYERSHSYHNALICGLWPDGFGPPPPPGPHWDDAVVEITTMNGLDPVPTLKRSRAWSAQEAMDQIAADSRAFSEFLTRLSPRTTTQRDSPSDQQAETDSNLVLAQVNGSDQTDHCDLEQPVTQGPVGTKSDRKQSWDSAFAPLHPPPGTNSLLCHPPASGLSDHEPAVVPSSDRSNSSPLSSPSSLKWADNSAVNANMDHARQVLEPLMQDFLLSPSSEVDGSTSMNRWKSLDETYQACSQPVSSSFSHYFYELPQITMARRMCMLKHERRLDETRWLNSSSSLVTDDATDKVDHIASTADETQVTNTSEELDESAPHESSGKSESQFSRTLRKCKRRKSESYAHTESVVDTSEAGGLQRPSNLSELIKSTQHALHLSSGSPLFSSSMCQLATSTTTSTSTPTNKTATSVTATPPPECAHSQSGRRMSDTVVYRPWKPLDAISQADLFMDLGLDDTDNVLAFGPDFSYRSSTQLTPTDWSTDLTPTGSDAPTVSDMLRTVLRAEESYRFGLDLILSSQWNSEHMSTETNNAG